MRECLKKCKSNLENFIDYVKGILNRYIKLENIAFVFSVYLLFKVMKYYKVISSTPDLDISNHVKVIVSIITVIGVFLTAAGSIYIYKKQDYNKYIVQGRLAWVNNMKDYVSELIGLSTRDLPYDDSKNDYFEKREKAHRLEANIILNLNHKDEKEYIEKLSDFTEKIVGLKNDSTEEYREELAKLRDKFTKESAVIFKVEWETIKSESKGQTLSTRQKTKLKVKCRKEFGLDEEKLDS